MLLNGQASSLTIPFSTGLPGLPVQVTGENFAVDAQFTHLFRASSSTTLTLR